MKFDLVFFIRLFVLAMASLAIQASHADECSDILRPELMTRSLRQTSGSSSNAEIKWACSATLSEMNRFISEANSRAGGGGGGLKLFNWISLSGSGNSSSSSSVTQNDFDRWKQDNCRYESADQSRSAFEYYAQQELSPTAINAWRACKVNQRQQPLSCWVSQQSPNQVVFHYNWNGNAVELPSIREFSVTRGSESSYVSQGGESLYIGEATKIIARDPRRTTLITLNAVLSQRYAYSCVGYVPATPVALPPPPPPVSAGMLVGMWCSDKRGTWEWSLGKGAGTIKRTYLLDHNGNIPLTNVVEPSDDYVRPLGNGEFEVVYPPPMSDGRTFYHQRYKVISSSEIYLFENQLFAGNESKGYWKEADTLKRCNQ